MRTRDALIEAAAELFDRDGYEVTSLAAVTARAQVSAGALYFHFATKADLAAAVTAAAGTRLRQIIAAHTHTAHTHTRTDTTRTHTDNTHPGIGTGTEGGADTDTDTDTETGTDTGTDTGAGIGAEAGADTGVGTGAGAGVGAGGTGGGARARAAVEAGVQEGGGGSAVADAAGGVLGRVVGGGPVLGAGGGGLEGRAGELQRLIDATHVFVRGLSGDVVLRAGFALEGARAEYPAGQRAVEAGPVGRGAGGGGLAGAGGGLRGVWSGWVHGVLAAAEARGVLAPGLPARDVAATVVAATVGLEVLGARDPLWLAPDPLTRFWALVLPALAPPAVRGALEAGGSAAVH